MKIKAALSAVAGRFSQFPPLILPEVAFAGRSNVGKSSLLNALTNSNLAKSSRTPGRTQTINFYQCDDRYILVDLPGYGFAKAPEAEAERWTKLMVRYLQSRQNITVFVLIDGRHCLQTTDMQFLTMLQDIKRIKYKVIMSKMDKIPLLLQTTQVEKCKAQLRLDGHPDDVIPCSSLKKQGLDLIQDAVTSAINSFNTS